MAMAATESRPERLSGYCEWCGEGLPDGSREDRRYCSVGCRRDAFNDRAHDGRVASVRRLKSGRMSVVVHLEHDTGLKPGDQVKIG